MATNTETHHEASKPGMPQLDPTYFASQIFWLVVVLAAMYVLMSKWVVPRIASVVDGRERKVSGDLAEAESARQQAQAAIAAYEKEMAAARDASNAAIAASQREISDKSSSELAALDARLATEVGKAEAQIAQQAESARQQLQPAVVELADLIVEKVLHLDVSSAAVATKMKA